MVGRDSADGGGGLVGEVERGGAAGGRGSNDSLQSPRRRSTAKTKINPAAAAARQFASSNTTVNAFIGGKHKSWMTPSGDNNTPLAVNKQTGQKRPLLGQGAADPSQGALLYPPPLASPGVGAASSQQIPIPSAGSGRPLEFSASATLVHSISDHVGHPAGPLSVGHSPAPQSTRRPDIQPPSNSTSPLLANTISIQKDSLGFGSLGNNQTLPSPTPSDDVAQEERQGSHPVDTRRGSREQQSGAPGAADSPQPRTQDLAQGQVNFEQSLGLTDAQPHPELGEKLDELRKQYGAENVNNFLRLSESARASPTESILEVPRSHSSVPSKRLSESLPERRETGSHSYSPTTQHAQPPNPSALDKRRRTQADTSSSSSSIPSPGLSMTNSPGLVQGQFQGQPHGQVQGQTPNQFTNLVPNQVPNQIPSQVSNQVPNQVPDQVPNQVPGQVPNQVSDQVPSQALSQTPTAPYLNDPSSAEPSSHENQTPTQPSFVPSHQQRTPTTTTAPSLPPGYSLQEKRNQLICGTVPNRRPAAFQNISRPSLSNFLPVLDRDFRPNMEQNTELPRMRLLREACQEEDWFYVALHQMYCLSTVQPQGLAVMVGLSPKHLEGFQVVKELIKENKLLSQERLAWFAKFPSSLQDLYARSDLYRHAVGLVKDFLSVLPEAYGRFQNDCRSRGTPPLVHELVIVMKLQSLIFQRVVYIAIRRGMWGPTEDEYTRKMHEIFQGNQREYLAILDRQDTAQPASLQGILHAHQRIAVEYNNIRTMQLEFYGACPPTRRNSLVQSQHALRSLQGSQPLVPSTQVQNGPPEPNGQSTTSTTTTNAFPNHTPSVQGYNHTNTSQTPMTRAAPRGLSVNTQAAQQHPPTSLPSGARNSYASSPQTTSGGSPVTPGINAQLQFLQLQRLRQQQQQENLDRASLQRRTNQAGQRQNSIPITPGQTSSQAIPSPATAPQPNGPSGSNLGARFLNRRQIVASVPTGAPDPRYSPTLGGFLPGGMPGNPRQHPGNLGRPPNGRTRSNQTQARTPLLPPSNFTPSTNPGLPNPAVTALHQAHLRSPYLRSATLPSTNEEAKLYQCVRHFPLKPMIFPQERPLLSYSFDVSMSDSGRIANFKGGTAEPPLQDSRDLRRIRIVGPGSLMYRIRCVKLPSPEFLDKEDKWESRWVVAESKWPEHIFIDVNQTKMETRRKLHFGKDLPLDITDHVRPGENELKVSILRSPQELNVHYAIAVEAIEVTTHADILRSAKENLIPAQQSLDAIKTNLSAMPDDDDIAVVNNDLTINISDPFSARVFDIPARSRSCLHRECFDLETFLLTRASKPKRNGEPCMADEWKCPLCAGDARPHRLVIDGFLMDVRRELVVRHLDETRAIVVDKEGGWAPKAEPGDDDMGGEDGAVSAAATSAPAGDANATPAKEKVIVVIDLDDD